MSQDSMQPGTNDNTTHKKADKDEVDDTGSGNEDQERNDEREINEDERAEDGEESEEEGGFLNESDIREALEDIGLNKLSIVEEGSSIYENNSDEDDFLSSVNPDAFMLVLDEDDSNDDNDDKITGSNDGSTDMKTSSCAAGAGAGAGAAGAGATAAVAAKSSRKDLSNTDENKETMAESGELNKNGGNDDDEDKLLVKKSTLGEVDENQRIDKKSLLKNEKAGSKSQTKMNLRKSDKKTDNLIAYLDMSVNDEKRCILEWILKNPTDDLINNILNEDNKTKVKVDDIKEYLPDSFSSEEKKNVFMINIDIISDKKLIYANTLKVLNKKLKDMRESKVFTCDSCSEVVKDGSIMCDRCLLWYHYKCARISAKEAKIIENEDDNNTKWFCQYCINHYSQ